MNPSLLPDAKPKHKTLYEKKWEAYNATLVPVDRSAPPAPQPVAMHGIHNGLFATQQPPGAELPPLPQPTVQLQPKTLPFGLMRNALAPRLDVIDPNAPVSMAGDDPSLSLAFQEAPSLASLPANLRYNVFIVFGCVTHC